MYVALFQIKDILSKIHSNHVGKPLLTTSLNPDQVVRMLFTLLSTNNALYNALYNAYDRHNAYELFILILQSALSNGQWMFTIKSV